MEIEVDFDFHTEIIQQQHNKATKIFFKIIILFACAILKNCHTISMKDKENKPQAKSPLREADLSNMYAAVDMGEYKGDAPQMLGIFDSLERAKERINDYVDSTVIAPDSGFHLAVFAIAINKPMNDYYDNLNPVWAWGKE